MNTLVNDLQKEGIYLSLPGVLPKCNATAMRPRSELPFFSARFLQGEAVSLCAPANSETSLIYPINEKHYPFVQLSLQGRRPEGPCDGDMV
jgi:hypothetical protein